MTIKRFVFNPVGVNTYVVYDESKQAVLIDPACFNEKEQQELSEFIDQEELKIVRIINTHLHFDHCFGLNFAIKRYKAPFDAHLGDEPFLRGMNDQALMFGIVFNERPPAITNVLKEGDTIAFGRCSLSVIHVPGHSSGSLCFYSREYKALFTGDVLFNESIGRTDLPTGNYDQLIDGIRSKLLTLPNEIIVYPGHGESTSIAHEKLHNFYLSK